MKLYKVINYLKWFIAFAVFGVTIYAIVQGWDSIKNFFKPSAYASDPKKGQTWFEKNFPNVAEAKDLALKPQKKILEVASKTYWGAWFDSLKASFKK